VCQQVGVTAACGQLIRRCWLATAPQASTYSKPWAGTATAALRLSLLQPAGSPQILQQQTLQSRTLANLGPQQTWQQQQQQQQQQRKLKRTMPRRMQQTLLTWQQPQAVAH
jgi:hypothetical protein